MVLEYSRLSVLVHSAALLCLDSFFIAETDMPRHQKRIKTTILAHTTTLNLLHDSVHWFIVTIDTTTMTITFQNSAGTYGQQAWKLLLLRWLRQHTPGPWQAVQGTSPRQPRGTECGTHTLFINMIAYTTNKPHPDTSTIQWSHNMRTNADPHTQPHCSRRVHSTRTRHRSFIGSRNHTQPHTYTGNTHTQNRHTHKNTRTATRQGHNHKTWSPSDTSPQTY